MLAREMMVQVNQGVIAPPNVSLEATRVRNFHDTSLGPSHNSANEGPEGTHPILLALIQHS